MELKNSGKGCEKLRSENVKGFKIVSGSNTK
jgi:hypothetical protein